MTINQYMQNWGMVKFFRSPIVAIICAGVFLFCALKLRDMLRNPHPPIRIPDGVHDMDFVHGNIFISSPIPPWTVVCDDHGHFNFTWEDGKVNRFCKPYDSWEDANWYCIVGKRQWEEQQAQGKKYRTIYPETGYSICPSPDPFSTPEGTPLLMVPDWVMKVQKGEIGLARPTSTEGPYFTIGIGKPSPTP